MRTICNKKQADNSLFISFSRMRYYFFILLFMLGFNIYCQDNKNVKPINDFISKERLDDKSKQEPDTNNQIIIYDFKTSKFEEASIKPKQQTPTILKISNINPLFYKIEITPKDIAIRDPFLYQIQKDSIKKVETKQMEISDLELNRQLFFFEALNYNKSPTATNLNNKTEEIKKLHNDIEEKKNELLNISKNTENATKRENDSTKVKKDKDSLENVFKIKVQQYKDLIDGAKKIDDLKSNISKLLLLYNEDYLEFYNNSMKLFEIGKKYNNYIDKINRPELTHQDYINFNSDSKNIETVSIIKKDNIDDYYNEVKSFDKEYLKIVKSYFETTNNTVIDRAKSLSSNDNDDFKEFYNLFIIACNKIRDNAKSIHDSVLKMKLSKKLNQVETLHRILRNKENYEFVSVPIQGLEDYLEFDVKIYSKTTFNDPLSIDKSKSFKYFEYLKGGIRYDFSVGTVFDFGVKNKTYEVVPNYFNANVFNLQQVDNNRFKPTLAGMFHTSFRNTSMYSFGLSLGASLSTTELDINSIFTGVSLLIGKREKIIFTMGPSFIKTSELKSQYVTQPIVEQGFNAATAVVENFKVGFFFGITYNLTKKQKDSFKIN